MTRTIRSVSRLRNSFSEKPPNELCETYQFINVSIIDFFAECVSRDSSNRTTPFSNRKHRNFEYFYLNSFVFLSAFGRDFSRNPPVGVRRPNESSSRIARRFAEQSYVVFVEHARVTIRRRGNPNRVDLVHYVPYDSPRSVRKRIFTGETKYLYSDAFVIAYNTRMRVRPS